MCVAFFQYSPIHLSLLTGYSVRTQKNNAIAEYEKFAATFSDFIHKNHPMFGVYTEIFIRCSVEIEQRN